MNKKITGTITEYLHSLSCYRVKIPHPQIEEGVIRHFYLSATCSPRTRDPEELIGKQITIGNTLPFIELAYDYVISERQSYE